MLLTLGLAVVAGVALGLLGGGGAILMVPILTYATGWAPAEAITGSLFVVGVASMLGTVFHARRGNVRWRTGLVLAAAAMIGTFAGGLASAHVPAAVLMILFSAVMLTAGCMMIRRRNSSAPADQPRATSWPWILILGAVIGAMSGLVGAGGGFLIVPALTLLVGLPMTLASGTSLLVITLQSASGLAAHLLNTAIEWPVILIVATVTLIASWVGVMLAGLMSEVALRRVLGSIMIGAGLVMGIGQLDA